MLLAAQHEGLQEDQSVLLLDVKRLRDAILAGDLKKRLKPNGEGELAVVRECVNEILDTVLGVLDRTVESVDGMSRGCIPEPFTDGFPGEFVRAKEVCNGFIDVINRRNVQIRKMTEAATRGDLHVRARVEEFTGVNRRIFEGFNAMFDAWLAPVAEIERVLTALARMDLTARVTGKYEGEYERIACALNTVCTTLTQEVEQIRKHTLTLASTSEELSAVTKTLLQGAIDNSHLATSVSNSSGQVSSDLTAVSTGSNRMLDSIREIASNTVRASGVVRTAMAATDTTTRKMANLEESSRQISKVIKVIKSITQQTNLLALNATIEAARAGEAGKGFAVVANEVKELAKSTAQAAEEVGRSVAAIQHGTQESVAGIAEIAAVTNSISDISHVISAAVEEQSTTTTEMGRYLAAAARTAAEIAREMHTLAASAEATTAGATQTNAAILELNKTLAQLQSFVAIFTV